MDKRSKQLKIEQRQLTQLVYDPSNLRQHSERNIEAIKSSLTRFGQQKPIVIDAKNIVHAGNGTLEAAKQLGWESIACVMTDLSDAELTAFAIADNRTAELANWDQDSLASTLQSLDAVDESVLADLAFTQEELLAMLPQSDDVIDDDEIPTPPKDPITKKGDVWICGDHRLMCGDSTDSDQISKLMNGDQVDLLFTSPPYALGEHIKLTNNKSMNSGSSPYVGYDDTSENWPDLMQGFFDAASDHVSGGFVINVQSLAGNKRQLAEFIAVNSDRLCDVAIWDKTHVQPAMAEGVMSSQFEYLLIFSKNKEASRRVPLASWRGTQANVYQGTSNNSNEASEVHAATMPLHLPTWVISDLCDQAMSVFEPFAGTGTTMIACEQLGRICYSMELEPQYCDVTIERWQNLTGKKASKA